MIKIKKSTSFIIYLFIFSIIYQSGSVRAAIQGDGILFQLTRLLVLFLPFCLFLKLGITKNMVSIAIIFLESGIFIVLINYILYPEAIWRLIYKICIFILSACIYVRFIDKEININEYIYNSIIFITFLSLFFYIMVEILHLNIPYSIVQAEGSYSYRNYFEIFFSYHYNQIIPRFSGLFWEPGVNAIYMSIGVYIHIYKKKKSKIILLLLYLGLLLAQSTMGYCIATFLFVFYLINNKRNISKEEKNFIILFFIFALIISAKVVKNKILMTGYNEFGSAHLRYADFINGLKLWTSHPLFGTGFGNQNLYLSHNRGNSNGLITYMYTTGIFGLIIAFSPYIRNLIKTTKKQKQLIWIIMIIIFNLMEPIYELPIMAFLLALEYIKAIHYNGEKEI